MTAERLSALRMMKPALKNKELEKDKEQTLAEAGRENKAQGAGVSRNPGFVGQASSALEGRPPRRSRPWHGLRERFPTAPSADALGFMLAACLRRLSSELFQ